VPLWLSPCPNLSPCNLSLSITQLPRTLPRPNFIAVTGIHSNPSRQHAHNKPKPLCKAQCKCVARYRRIPHGGNLGRKPRKETSVDLGRKPRGRPRRRARRRPRGGVSEGVSDGAPDGAPGGVPDGVPDGVPCGATSHSAGGFSIVSRPLSVIRYSFFFLSGFSAKPPFPNSYRSWPTLSGVSPIALPISDGLAGSVHYDNASSYKFTSPTRCSRKNDTPYHFSLGYWRLVIS